MKSVRQQVYDLRRELVFWERVHEHEPPDQQEFDLADKIRQLENRDEFGIARYNGTVCDDEDYREEYIGSPPRSFKCKYCGEGPFVWAQHNGKWRPRGRDGIHECKKFNRRGDE